MARTSLLACLPQVFTSTALSGTPLAALVGAADGMHGPVSDTLDHLETQLDAFRASEAMVCYLASWVDLGWLTVPVSGSAARSALPGGSAPLRDLISQSADLAARRGTPGGMVRFLELATGLTGFTVEDAGHFHLRVHVPTAATAQHATVTRIVEAIKPAHVTAEVISPEATPDDTPGA